MLGLKLLAAAVAGSGLPSGETQAEGQPGRQTFAQLHPPYPILLDLAEVAAKLARPQLARGEKILASNGCSNIGLRPGAIALNARATDMLVIYRARPNSVLILLDGPPRAPLSALALPNAPDLGVRAACPANQSRAGIKALYIPVLRSADEQAGCSTFVCPSWFGGLAQKGKGNVGVTADRSSASRSYGTLRACGDDPRSSPRGLVDQRCFWRTSARGLSAVAAEVDLPRQGPSSPAIARPQAHAISILLGDHRNLSRLSSWICSGDARRDIRQKQRARSSVCFLTRGEPWTLSLQTSLLQPSWRVGQQ